MSKVIRTILPKLDLNIRISFVTQTILSQLNLNFWTSSVKENAETELYPEDVIGDKNDFAQVGRNVKDVSDVDNFCDV